MAIVSIKNVRLAGIAAAVPPLEEVQWEKINVAPDKCVNARKRKETPFRRAAKVDQCQSDFCVEAAKGLMADLGWKPEEIDVVVMATLTADYPIPATSIIVQDRLGIPKTAVAFDLPSGGIGFLHGLQTAASMISAGFLKKALLLTGNVSKTPESSDSEWALGQIHGHSGSVCALEFCEGSPEMVFESGGDGAAFDSFYMPVGGVRNPPDPAMFSSPDGVKFASEYVLDCEKLANMSKQELPGSVRRVLEAAKKTMSEVDGCYFNPMSMPVDAVVRKELGIARDKFHSDLPEFGASGSGSIPLAMLARGSSGLKSGKRTSLIGAISAGLAWGSAVITTENLVCPEILEM